MPDRQETTPQGAASEQAQKNRSTRVLVVEDEVMIRLDLSEELRMAGFWVCEASSAEEALALLASGLRIDIVFSDYQLSGAIDGWELYQRVSRHDPGLPFILTSAQVAPGDAQRAAVPFFPKPYLTSDVADLIARTLDTDMDTDEQE